METSLKTGFAQIFSCCPKNRSCPNFGGAAAPLAPPGPYAYDTHKKISLHSTMCIRYAKNSNLLLILNN